MVKGTEKTQVDLEKKFYVGLSQVTVVAVNPTRKQQNEIFGKEDSDDDKEIEYLSEDKEGNPRVKISFILFDEKNGKYFFYSFFITKRDRISEKGDKAQFISQTLDTGWAPFKLDSEGKPTEEVDEDQLQDWFINFTDKDNNPTVAKEYRRSLFGEEELATIVKAWLGGLNFKNDQASVTFDPARLLAEDFEELQELVDHEWTRPFVVLLGVETDENDPSKKYQKVFGKTFLPNGFLKYVEGNFKGAGDWAKKTWQKFDAKVNGAYGFDAFTELVPLREYNKDDNSGDSEVEKAEKKDPKTSKF